MKRLLLFLLLLLPLPLLLTGCSADTGLGARLAVRAVGVDRDGEAYTLTVQLYVPEDEPQVVTASGRDLSALTRACELRAGRPFHWGSCEIAVLGKGLADVGVTEAVRFLCGYTDPDALTVVTAGTAERLLTIPLPELSTAESPLHTLTENAARLCRTVLPSLRELCAGLREPYQTAALPLISIPPEVKDASDVSVSVALLTDGVYAAHLTGGEAETLALLLGPGSRLRTVGENAALLRRKTLRIDTARHLERSYVRLSLVLEEPADEPTILTLRTDLDYLLRRLIVQNGMDFLLLHQRFRSADPAGYEQLDPAALLPGCQLSVSVSNP